MNQSQWTQLSLKKEEANISFRFERKSKLKMRRKTLKLR